MTNVWCVRADFGTYTQQFVKGGYVGIGWMPNRDLCGVKTRDELYPFYREDHPDDTSNLVIGQQVGQIARFLFEIQVGDYVITPAADTEWLHYGKLEATPSYFYATRGDGCPYPHRRHVMWDKERIKRGSFSVPFQNTIRSSLTVFAVSQRDEFLAAIGRADLAAKPADTLYDPYKLGTKIKAGIVKQLRQAIPFGGQGAFITTAEFQDTAAEIALEANFPRIGLINGRQLVDLLIEHWSDIPQEFRERLGLKPGLVRT